MSTENDSFDESELGAFIESPLGARNGEVPGTFVMSAQIERAGQFRNVLLRMSLPEMEAITSINTGNPLRRFGGRDGKIFRIDRGELVGERFDWERRFKTEFARRDADEYGQSVVPAPPETLVFSGGDNDGVWRLGEPRPEIGFPIRLGSSQTRRRFTMTVMQFASYVQNFPGGQNIKTFGIVYRVVARESLAVESVTRLLAAATNSSAPFFLRPTSSGTPQHLAVPIDLWTDENIGWMELDTGDRLQLRIEDNLITGAFPVTNELASVRRRKPGLSTRMAVRPVGPLLRDTYMRGTWVVESEPDRGFGFAPEEPTEENIIEVPDHDPVLGDVFPIFTDPDNGAAWEIRKLYQGMIRG